MKKLFFGFVLLSFCIPANSQLFWKITGKQLKNASYIFATTPYISTAIVDSIPGIFSCFTHCDVIIGQTAINNIDYQEKLLKNALLPVGRSMNQLISDDDKEFIDNELKSVLMLSLKEVSAMKPQVIYGMYRDELVKRATLNATDTDINSLFQLLAIEKGKTVLGVEDIENLLKNFADTANLQSQTKRLISVMHNKTTFQKEILQLSAIYRTGNIHKYYQTMLESEFALAETKSEYLQKLSIQNSKWLSKIEEISKTTSAFVVVDIMQLADETGLLQLLRKAGYKVVEVGR